MKYLFVDSLLISTVDIIKLINFSSPSAATQGAGLTPFPANGTTAP
jgi:hypothetical protein